jgi:hypothetical protein
MTKNPLFAAVLLSLALSVGCAKGGNGIVPTPPSISIAITSPANTSPTAIYPTQTLTLSATVTGTTSTTVTWSLSCSSGGANSCGTLTPVTPAPTPATATYAAPPCVPQSPTCLSGSEPTITATLTADSSIAGTLGINLVDITTEVTPATPSVGTTGGNNGLTQQFAAVAVPTDAPQTFTWTCTVISGAEAGHACTTFSPAPGVASPGLAVYTADDNCTGNCVQISAASSVDPIGCVPNPSYCTSAAVSLVPSRVSGTYAFQFSGYKSGSPVWVAGTFTANTSGTITSGAEEILTASGPSAKNPISITGGSYTPTSSDPNNSNNAGTLTLTLPADAYPNQYQVVLDSAGDIEMIESDGQGTGSGIAEISSSSLFNGAATQTYAFGFTGVDGSGNRVGYVGVMPLNGLLQQGVGSIVNGQVDVNDAGTANSYSNVTGTYQADTTIGGLWHVSMTLASNTTLDFDFFVASGTTKTTKTTPLTFYAISTSTPAVSGTMVLQDSSLVPYGNKTFNGTSISALTGVTGANTNVSLTLGETDGSGDFAGFFDQNNAGTILSEVQFPSSTQSPSPYTYCAAAQSCTTPSSNGRYVFQMLGNPGATPVAAPLPFVLYASGANRGFLLDQSSPSVMTGTMNAQGKALIVPPLGAVFSASYLPGTYAAATTISGNSAVTPIAANLLLDVETQAGVTTYNLSGTEYPPGPSKPLAGIYSLGAAGDGTIAPVSPATTPNYAIYALGTSGCNGTPKNPTPVCAVTSFFMMDETTTPLDTTPSIIFAQQ